MSDSDAAGMTATLADAAASTPAALAVPALEVHASDMLRLVKSLRLYSMEVGETGHRVLGGRWTAAVAGVDAAASELTGQPLPRSGETPATVALKLPATAAEMVARLNRQQELDESLRGWAILYLRPDIIDQTMRGMSRSFSDQIKIWESLVRQSQEALSNSRQQLYMAAPAAGRRLARLWRAESVADAAGAATATDVEADLDELMTLAERDDCSDLARAFVVGVVSTVAGTSVVGSSAGFAATGSSAGSTAMGTLDPRRVRERLTGIVSRPLTAAVEFTPRVPADTMPPSAGTYLYTLDRFISRKAALEFGPIASSESGLSFKTVQRLQPVVRVADSEAVAAVATAAVAATTAAVAAATAAVNEWAELSADVVAARLQEAADAGWGPELRLRYEELNEKQAPAVTVLVRELRRSFEQHWDRETARNTEPELPPLGRLVFPPERPVSWDYVRVACNEYFKGVKAPNIGGVSGKTRERTRHRALAAGRCLQALDAAGAVWRRLEAAWSATKSTQAEAKARPGARSRESDLRTFGALVEAALAPVKDARGQVEVWLDVSPSLARAVL